jgi:hypothetical protein
MLSWKDTITLSMRFKSRCTGATTGFASERRIMVIILSVEGIS